MPRSKPARRRKSPPRTALRPVAVGRRPARRVGPVNLDRAARELNQIYTRQGLETAKLLGNYILEHFFGGDVTRFRERGEDFVSFRRLAERDDLQMSASTLWTSVAVVEQLEQLPAELAAALPLSHHRLLLSLRDPREKLATARKAVQRGLSKRQLEAEVRRRHLREPETPRRGRRPEPALLKALSRIQKSLAFTMEQAEELDFESLPRERTAAALDELEERIQQVRSFLAMVRNRL